jgi:hypothetical protein
MYVFFEYAACVVLIAMVATLLFAVWVIWIIIEQQGMILGQWREIAESAVMLVVRDVKKGAIGWGLSAIRA